MVSGLEARITHPREFVAPLHTRYVRIRDGAFGIRHKGDGRAAYVAVGRSGGSVGVPLNAELEGKAYPAISFRIDEDHVRRFAGAIGDDGASVPPTFATVPEILSGLDQVVADEDLGIDFIRVVHGDEEFEWGRPVRVGETLRAQTVIESIRTKGGHEFLVLRTTMRDEAGEAVVIARSTMIVRGNT